MQEIYDYNVRSKKTEISLSETTANIKVRLYAHLMDRIILLIILSPFIYRYLNKERIFFIFGIIFLFIAIIYYIILPIIVKGKTLGKLFFKLKIVSINGEKANSGVLIGRGFIYVLLPIFELVYGYYITILGCLFWISSLLFTTRNRYKQALHDKYSFTLVVNEEKYNHYLSQL